MNYIAAKKPVTRFIQIHRKRNINRITLSNSDSNINKCNHKDECNEDIIIEILQELVIEEERNKESTIQFSECNRFNDRQ